MKIKLQMLNKSVLLSTLKKQTNKPTKKKPVKPNNSDQSVLSTPRVDK